MTIAALSIITIAMLLLTIVVINLIAVASDYNDIKRTEYKYSEMFIEFTLFVELFVIKKILNRLLRSSKNPDGQFIALKEVTDIREVFYQGMIIGVIGSMAKQLLNRFYSFYKKYKKSEIIFSEVSSIIEMYTMKLSWRIVDMNEAAKTINRKIIENNSNQIPVDLNDYVNSEIIKSVYEDYLVILSKVNKDNPVNNNVLDINVNND